METLQLVDRVVQLGVGVAQLLAGDEEFETLRQFGVLAVALAQGRHLYRVVAHEGGLYEVALAILSEDGVDELSLAHRVVDLDIQAAARLAQLLLALARDVVPRLLLDGLGHGKAAEGGLERDPVLAYHHIGGAVHGQTDAFQQPFREAHHPAVVLVGDVYLHAGELGVVGAVHALVAEVLAQLVDAVEAAHDEPLEV